MTGFMASPPTPPIWYVVMLYTDAHASSFDSSGAAARMAFSTFYRRLVSLLPADYFLCDL